MPLFQKGDLIKFKNKDKDSYYVQTMKGRFCLVLGYYENNASFSDRYLLKSIVDKNIVVEWRDSFVEKYLEKVS